MPSKVFLSYRRSDSAWATAAIHAVLCDLLGEDSVFKDTDSIRPGEDWQTALNTHLDASEAVLVVIGPDWTSCTPDLGETPRIQSDGDIVRTEISRALDRDVPVVPVLIDQADLPSLEELPHDIHGLREKQAARISSSNYRADIETMFKRLQLRGSTGAPLSSPSAATESDEALILSFLQQFSKWGFSPLRIKNWGGRQAGFERLADLSTDHIRTTVEPMIPRGDVRIQTSSKGNRLYRAATN